ncbi:aggregation factor core [Pseudahrensia aquimaris]|uniref:Aggregation factor core n=1 Tax=Pseudahrensia aquimaris TaxID=744461 RepID=A0ABW3FEZ8_9HYPH
MKTLSLAALLVALPLSAQAELRVKFDEGAPKDRFTIRNAGKCTIKDAQITVDLSGSKSGLIFDVTSAGAGVEVFQPLDIVAGRQSLSKIPKVRDGDKKIVFDVRELSAGKSLAFTIDVDDTVGTREITVSGSEIEGAGVRFKGAEMSGFGNFSTNARAVVKTPSC